MPKLQVWDTVQDSYHFVFGNPSGFLQKTAKPALACIVSYTLLQLSLAVMQRYQLAAKAAKEKMEAAMEAGGPAVGVPGGAGGLGGAGGPMGGGMPPPMPGPGGAGGFGGPGPGHFPLMHILHQLLPVLPVVIFGIITLLCFFTLAACLVRHVLVMPQPQPKFFGFWNRDSGRQLLALFLFVISFAVIEAVAFGYSKLLLIAGGGSHATLGTDLFLLGKIIMFFGGLYVLLRGIWLMIPTVVAEKRVLALRSWALGAGKFPEFLLVLIMTLIPVFIVAKLLHILFASNDINAILYAPTILGGLFSRPGLHLVCDYVCGGVFRVFLLLLIVKCQMSCYCACCGDMEAAAPTVDPDASFQSP